MPGSSGKAFCPHCESEQNVTLWENEWVGKDGRMMLRFTQCDKCKYKWLSSEQLMYNINEILRLLGLHPLVPSDSSWWHSDPRAGKKC